MDISFTLLINGMPADQDLLAALQQIEVEDHADMADILRLRFAIGVRDGCANWSIIDEDLFQALDEITIMVQVGTLAEPLIVAHVTQVDGQFSNQPGQSMLNVVAMDPTMLMNLRETVRSWPNMSDSEIATAIFTDAAYTRHHRIVPVVETTTLRRQETETTVMQRGTDIQFLRELAERNGFECYLEVNPLTRQVEGHFHPPRPEENPQGVLSVNLGESTNVNSFNARHDMLRPTAVRATGLDAETQSEQQAQAEGQTLSTLGAEPTLGGGQLRETLVSQSGLFQTGELQTYAQAEAERSSWAITAEGELHTPAYGRILRAKRPVEVRGAGRQFSGVYYVERVHHTFSGDSYTQRFTLRRNALGLSGEERFMEDLALPV